MRRIATSMLVGGLAMLGVSMAYAHPDAAEHAKHNVLPADMDRGERLELMKHFAQSLGVRCSYCHVGEEGAPLSTYDFASDAKPAKGRARQMLMLTHALNQNDKLPGEDRASLTDMSQNRVTCYTCHRGELRPATMVPPPEG